jgi:hypothetical protein
MRTVTLALVERARGYDRCAVCAGTDNSVEALKEARSGELRGVNPASCRNGRTTSTNS